MKVKSLLLSMCAIAALASCSQNDDEISGGSNAPEAKVTIKFAGSGVATRALGKDDAIVNTLSAFFFDKTGKIINGEVPVKLASVTVDNKVTLKTTTDATQVILVANAPEKTSYAGITTTEQLKNKVISSLGTTDGGGNTPITQTATYLTMSGWSTITMAEQKGTANVTLHFIAAKISVINFSFKDTNSKTHYAADETDLSTHADKWFYIKQAYLMTAQTNSTLMPSDASGSAWTGNFGPTSEFEYTGGLKWDNNTVWKPEKPAYKVSDNYLNSSITAKSPTTGDVGNVLGSKIFYVFENNSQNATAVVVEARCNIKDINGQMQQESRYFTVYFGEKKAQGNFDTIHGGSNYTITLTANNSFDPDKGTGGGGTPDPTQPTIPADVTVTVTPASWTPNALISKDFN